MAPLPKVTLSKGAIAILEQAKRRPFMSGGGIFGPEPELRPGGVIVKTRDPLLQERQKTHGDFKTNAEKSQAIKAIIRNSNRNTNKAQEEALEMIALKLSRILSGQANFKDHWDDIAGYAKLGSEACD